MPAPRDLPPELAVPRPGALTIASVRHFAHELAGELAEAAGDAVVGVYVHGSAVLGDWQPAASDVDVLVVVADVIPGAIGDRIAAVLAAARECPGVGLEATVVEASAAADPRRPWPFVVHVTTAAPDRKVVRGTAGRGDVDLILHYAVTRDVGWAAFGPRPETVIGAIPEGAVIAQLADELRWAVAQADESYAVLNACRALRYRAERVLCSKSDGGEWALARHIEPTLVQRALDARRLAVSRPMTEDAAAWVLGVANSSGD